MSRLYFHSEHGTAELLGSERAYMGGLVSSVACGFVPDMPYGVEGFAELLGRNPQPGLNRNQFVWAKEIAEVARQHVGSLFGGDTAPVGGVRLSWFTLALNTALKVGCDQIKLAARLHGQCELHAYVEGPDRRWLAAVMQRGLDHRIFRQGAGWEGVIELLRSRDDGPVVTSYSVGDSFPNQGVTTWRPGPDSRPIPDYYRARPDVWEDLSADEQEEQIEQARQESWYDLPDAEKWATSVEELRNRRFSMGNRLKPSNWQRFHFGNGVSLLDIAAPDWADRVAAAVRPPSVLRT